MTTSDPYEYVQVKVKKPYRAKLDTLTKVLRRPSYANVVEYLIDEELAKHLPKSEKEPRVRFL